MKTTLLSLLLLPIITHTVSAQQAHTFTSTDGKTLEDRVIKYDSEKREVILERHGKASLDVFSPIDQAYIQKWNQVAGFTSSMRFKVTVEKSNWARMKHEQTVTPFFMDVIQLPGKSTPTHQIIMVDDYEEYNAIYLEADGYTITLRNQNLFPIENIVVESKIFYEQEYYTIPDSLFTSMESEYTEVTTTNKVRFLSETIPVIVPRESVSLYSECATIVDHQLNRNSLTTVTEEEEDEEAEEDEESEEDEEVEEVVEGFGDWDDHGRRRSGKVQGVWVRVGIENQDGTMVWREFTEPSSLPKKVSWDKEWSEPRD